MHQFTDKHTSIVNLSQLIESTNFSPKQLDQFLQQHNLPFGTMENPSGSLSLEQEFALVHLLIKHSKNPQLGLIAGRCYRLNTFGPLGLAVTSVANFKGAIELFIQYLEITYTPFNVSFGVTDTWGYVEFCENEPLGDLYTYYRDRDLSFSVTAIKDIYPEAYPHTKKRLELTSPPPENPEIYEHFFDCPVDFNQKSNRFLFDRKALDFPLPQANKLNLKIFTAQCDEELEDRKKTHTFSEEISQEIESLFKNHIPTQEEIADTLNITTRTIRRKLADENCTFQQLLKEALEQRATNLLQNTSLSIEEIGNQIGYSESAAFIRAFRRWTGKTPLQARKHI
ncbi:MAG: AraC family transcriptional regulator [Pseudomonadales bacterium]|nr:AraC family transcriptional regulator [Pseudomonadales bacterium]